MKKIKIVFCVILLILVEHKIYSQTSILENDRWKLSIRDNKTIESLFFKESNNNFAFSENISAGPSWYAVVNDEIYELESNWESTTKNSAHFKNINLSIEYKDDEGNFLMLATIKNNGNTPLQPDKLGIRLGIDTYLDEYPSWNKKLFPSLLRCESTHFWGYFMSPTGKILSVISPDPIASWSHDYSKSWGEPPYQYNGHRITSVNLDLINALPLPTRHPQDLWQVLPGETKTFRIYLNDLKDLSELNRKVSGLAKAPVIEIPSTACENGEEIDFSVLSGEEFTVEIVKPNGGSDQPQLIHASGNLKTYRFNKTTEEGHYKIYASSNNGKLSEAIFYVRKPYSWYMQKGMQAVIDYPQKASISHCESWYGFYTTYAGGKHFKNDETIEKVDKQFKKIYPIVFDSITHVPVSNKHRIQNVSSMIGILVDRYQLFKEERDLFKALKLSEFFLESQTPDGAYRAHKIHYTSVLYNAKSLMELLEVLEPLRKQKIYNKQYKKIYASVKLSMDELERNRADIQTEGERTFEDGMISCSALQLGQFALLQNDMKAREKYKNAAIDLLTQHECLEQLVIPDARMRSGSHRFWEAQYDVLMDNNFLNSPHGWSSWSTYAQYYAYLLTGETKYLLRTFNGLDAAMQMIDLKNGNLRWAFAVNPSLNITQIKDNIEGATPLNFPGVHYHANKYPNQKYVAGEQYIDMVGHWFFANSNDNDVHEHFKCLEEIALDKAYVAEKANGEIISYNCSVIRENDKIKITPNEDTISKVHLNLKNKTNVEVFFKSKAITKKVNPEMTWITMNY